MAGGDSTFAPLGWLQATLPWHPWPIPRPVFRELPRNLGQGLPACKPPPVPPPPAPGQTSSPTTQRNSLVASPVSIAPFPLQSHAVMSVGAESRPTTTRRILVADPVSGYPRPLRSPTATRLPPRATPRLAACLGSVAVADALRCV